LRVELARSFRYEEEEEVVLTAERGEKEVGVAVDLVTRT
jgi:hypothetical protein